MAHEWTGDPRLLRAIAHPERARLLAEVEAAGTLRAADAAAMLEIPANRASFHLRQLAKYGLIEEAPEEARDRRDRVWRLAGDGLVWLNMSEVEATPEGRAAARVFRRTAAERAHHAVDVVYSAERVEGVHRSVTDASLRLTAEEAAELSERLGDLIEEWSARVRSKSVESAPDQTYQLLAILQPRPN